MRQINRREFVQVTGAILPLSLSVGASALPIESGVKLRMGGPVPKNEFQDPEAWITAHRKRGYRAAQCPLSVDAKDSEITAYRKAAAEADIVIAEVGAFGNNPISPDSKIRQESITNLIRKLELAERIGACCCVSTSGSRGERWARPDPANLTTETFDLIVEVTYRIIDAVKPTQTTYTLETMPWAYPDSTESYVRLIRQIDRPSHAVHFDPVNLVSSPQRYFNNGPMIRDFYRKLGAKIRSCHAKDILLEDKLTTHLNEVPLGTGALDYQAFLGEASKFPQVPLMLEHLKIEQYPKAAAHLRSVADRLGLSFG